MSNATTTDTTAHGTTYIVITDNDSAVAISDCTTYAITDNGELVIGGTDGTKRATFARMAWQHIRTAH